MADEMDRPDALPYSALAVLFGDLFVEGQGSWELPWRGARVDERRLASEALAAALVGMAREGQVYLSTAVRKLQDLGATRITVDDRRGTGDSQVIMDQKGIFCMADKFRIIGSITK